jgi:hypothetical protein
MRLSPRRVRGSDPHARRAGYAVFFTIGGGQRQKTQKCQEKNLRTARSGSKNDMRWPSWAEIA